MSAVMLNNGLVHYEAWGRGQPIIFLHSWLGSWRYWVPTMDAMADRHRVYALDFWGFGESECRGCSYTLEDYVELLLGFIEKQGMREVNLVGHGLGGMVGLRAATARPDSFAKVVSIGMPLQGSSIGNIARTGTFSRLFGASRPSNIWSKVLRQMSLGNAEIFREMQEDTDNLSEELVQRVLEAVQTSDQTPLVQDLKAPLLLVYGDRDTVVGSEHYERLKSLDWKHNSETSEGASDWEAPIESVDGQGHALVLRQSGHFPFIDQEYTFVRLLLDYLAQESTLAVKKAWRRRVTQREYL